MENFGNALLGTDIIQMIFFAYVDENMYIILWTISRRLQPRKHAYHIADNHKKIATKYVISWLAGYHLHNAL